MSSGRRLSDLGDSISVTIPLDADGYLDRECSQQTCLGFFKVRPGTGLENVEGCICPYCGHAAPSDEFHTPAQLAYAEQVTVNEIEDAMGNELRNAFRGLNSGFVKVTVDQTKPGHVVYPHVSLPTRLLCTACACDFKVHGTQGKCPDCGAVNGKA